MPKGPWICEARGKQHDVASSPAASVIRGGLGAKSTVRPTCSGRSWRSAAFGDANKPIVGILESILPRHFAAEEIPFISSNFLSRICQPEGGDWLTEPKCCSPLPRLKLVETGVGNPLRTGRQPLSLAPPPLPPPTSMRFRVPSLFTQSCWRLDPHGSNVISTEMATAVWSCAPPPPRAPWSSLTPIPRRVLPGWGFKENLVLVVTEGPFLLGARCVGFLGIIATMSRTILPLPRTCSRTRGPGARLSWARISPV